MWSVWRVWRQKRKLFQKSDSYRGFLFFASPSSPGPNPDIYLSLRNRMTSLMTNDKALKDDDYMTPKEVWESIKTYIPQNKVIWEAFYGDGKSGEYLRELGFNVIHEPIDFFKENRGDVIVSNPPFSLKMKVLQRLKELDKPFILLLPASTLGTKTLQELYGNDIQLIIPKGRISYNKNGKPTNGVWFASFFYCYKCNLQRDIIFL